MTTVEKLAPLSNDTTTTSDNIDDDPTLFEENSTTIVSLSNEHSKKTATIRAFRRSLYGLPFNQSSSSLTQSTPSTSASLSTATPSSSLLLYQLYALSALRRPSTNSARTTTNTCRTTSTSVHTNVSLSVTNIKTPSISKSTKENHRPCCLECHYRCTCVFIIFLILSLISLCLFLFFTNIGIRLTSCHCPPGYETTLSSSSTVCTCVDRNECLNGAGAHTCSGQNMQCINTMGSYQCRCRSGFTRHPENDSCVDINECDLYHPCNTTISVCINLPGRYYCQCSVSEANDNQCIPRNICTEQRDLCGPHGECIPSLSSSTNYQCQCRAGHKMFENGQCTKVNECALSPSVCERGRLCVLTRDRFDCCTSNATDDRTGECVECGLPVSRRLARIVNGDRSYRGQWPWMAVVGVYFRDDSSHWINITQKCAATLIANRYLLTAAHCLSNQLPTFDTMRLPNRYQSSLKDTYRVSFDVIDVESDITHSQNYQRDNKRSRTFSLEHTCIHPEFNHNTLLHDIAILKLKEPIVRSSLVDTICLPAKDQTIGNGTKVWVAGWGSNAEYSSSLNVLMHADLQVLPPSLCPSIESNDYQMCAGWSDGRKDACRGDSGGPLMLYTNNRWHIIGIVSFGDGCSRANSGGIYTRVSAYHEWITQIMSSSNERLNCSSAYDYTQVLTEISTVE